MRPQSVYFLTIGVLDMRLSKLTLAWLSAVSLSVGVTANADVEVDPNLTVDRQNSPSTTRTRNYGSNPVSYTYLGLAYISQDVDDYDCSQDGLQLYGSLDIDNDWFAVASLGDVSGSRCGSTRIAAGGGYKTAFNEQFDMYATLQFENISPDAGDGDSGLVLSGGFRGFFTRELEGVLELSHSTTGDATTGINLGGRYWFDNGIAATLDVGLGSDISQLMVGARINL